MKLFYYPNFHEEHQLNNQVNRACWYLGGLLPSSINFYTNINYNYKDESYFSHLLKDIYFDMVGTGIMKFHAAELSKHITPNINDIVILWRPRESLSKEESTTLKTWGGNGIKIYDVNIDRRMEGSIYIEITRESYCADTHFLEKNRRNFQNLLNKHKDYNQAFLFCTGPSISEYNNYNYDTGVKIICNSVINDLDFMEFVHPDIVTFADPIFHFGCSSYAQAFRDELSKVAEKYDFDIVIPIKYYPIFCYTMPHLIDRVVALPYEEKNEFVVNLSEEFSVRTMDNILTFMMLPLATSLAENIYIMGCDGRPLDEDDYFWKHNNKTQFTGEMESIKKAHPSFFRLEYNEYYLKHCDNLKEYFHKAEFHGNKFYSLGFSYIPALEERIYKFKKLTLDSNSILYVSINPDLKDESGHFYHYDMRISDELEDEEELLSLANKNVTIKDAPFMINPVFTQHTWSVRLNVNQNNFDVWCTELEEVINQLSILKRPVHVYMYPGAIRFYACMLRVWEKTQTANNLDFKLNLFFAHMDYAQPSFIKSKESEEYSRLLALYKRLNLPNLTLYADSEKLQKQFIKDFDTNLDLWPMINVTSPKLIKEAKKEKRQETREYLILFPGTGQLAKGYDLVCDLILSFAETPTFNGLPAKFLIRDQFKDSEKNNINLRGNFEKLKELPWVEVIKGHLEEKEYLHFYHRADIILLPYRQSAFYSRTSGCLIDALSFYKPVIAFQDTWLGDAVENLNTGATAIDGDISSILAAIESISERSFDYKVDIFDKFSPKKLKSLLASSGTDSRKGNRLLQSALINNELIKTPSFLVHSKSRTASANEVFEDVHLKKTIFKNFAIVSRISHLLEDFPTLHRVLRRYWLMIRS